MLWFSAPTSFNNERAVSMRKWSPTFRSKSVNGKTKLNLMVTSVWASVLWGSALWTLTKAMKSAIDSWSARTLSTILGIKRGAEEAMVEKIPSNWTRGTEETKPVTVKHGGETHPPMGRSCGEAPDEPLAGRSGESKSSTVLALGAAAPHRQVDRCSPEEIQNIPVGKSVLQMAQRWMHEEPVGEYWMVSGRPRPPILASC